jgi:hypothetical protein
MTSQDVPCKGPPLTLPVNRHPGYISSLRAPLIGEVGGFALPPVQGSSLTSCPANSQQIRLEAQPGQRINVSILNYGWHVPGRAPTSSSSSAAAKAAATRPSCMTYGHVGTTPLTSCDVNAREIPVFSSEGNVLTLTVAFKQSSDSQFLVRYQGKLVG